MAAPSGSFEDPGDQALDEPLVARVGKVAVDERVLVQRGAGEPVRDAARIVDAAVAIHQRPYAADVLRSARLARQAQHLYDLVPFAGRRRTQEVDQHERALALRDVAVELLAVLLR